MKTAQNCWVQKTEGTYTTRVPPKSLANILRSQPERFSEIRARGYATEAELIADKRRFKNKEIVIVLWNGQERTVEVELAVLESIELGNIPVIRYQGWTVIEPFDPYSEPVSVYFHDHSARPIPLEMKGFDLPIGIPIGLPL